MRQICSMHCFYLVEVEDVFKLGSMKPGAMLHDASREYEVSEFCVIVITLTRIIHALVGPPNFCTKGIFGIDVKLKLCKGISNGS